MSEKRQCPDTSDIVTGRHTSALRTSVKNLRSEMTPAEKILWSALRNNGLGGFHVRRQQIIDGFIVDFYCHAATTIIEIDGPIHQYQRTEDRIREDKLRARGLEVIRFTNDEVTKDLDLVLEAILRMFERRS